jgi:hypothetical protein
VWHSATAICCAVASWIAPSGFNAQPRETAASTWIKADRLRSRYIKRARGTGYRGAMAGRPTVIGAMVVVVLAGCGGAHNPAPRSTPPVSAEPPPPFGSGNDHERATDLANAIFRQRLRDHSASCEACLFTPLPVRKGERVRLDRFALRTEAVSWTPTHLLVQFVGSLVRPDNTLVKNVEVRVLIALTAHNTLKLAQLREHTLVHLRNHETPTRLPGKSEHP